METILTKSVIAISIVIIFCFNVLSQEKKSYQGEIPAPVTKNESNRSIIENRAIKSSDVLEFEAKMKKAKESGDLSESIKLQGEIDVA